MQIPPDRFVGSAEDVGGLEVPIFSAPDALLVPLFDNLPEEGIQTVLNLLPIRNPLVCRKGRGLQELPAFKDGETAHLFAETALPFLVTLISLTKPVLKF